MLAGLQSWVTVTAASMSMLAVATGIWLSLREYRIKVRGEARQQKTADIDAEVRLHTQFTELMQIANARSGYVLSEATAQYMLGALGEAERSPAEVRRIVNDAAVMTLPVGSASQDAAIAAIASLTQRYEVLREPGLQALRSLCNPMTSWQAKRYLELTCEALGAPMVEEGLPSDTYGVRERHVFRNETSLPVAIAPEGRSDPILVESGGTLTIDTELSKLRPLVLAFREDGVHLSRGQEEGTGSDGTGAER